MNYAAPAHQANMGQPVPRVDARLKVTGGATYASDADVKNAAYGYLVVSAISKGRITRIDDSEAKTVDGLLAIFTHETMADAIKQVPFNKNGGPASTSIVPMTGSS